MADDVNIPGITNKYNSQEAINKIMETKRVKLTEMEKEKENIIEKKNTLNEIKQKSILLQSLSKKLYGFEAPFDEKITQSSNEKAFSGTANKNAEIGEYKIKILQKAQSHKVSSNPLPKKFTVREGVYNFKVTNEIIKIQFSGGTLNDFVNEIKRQSRGLLKANVAFTTPNTQVLIMEAAKTGENNFITFYDEKTQKLFKEMGFYQEVPAYEKKFELKQSSLTSYNTNFNPVIKNDILTVDRLESYKFNLSEKIPYREGLIFEVDMKINILDPSKEEITIPGGPNFTKKGELNIFDIYVEGESSIVNIPPYKTPEKPEVVEDDHFIDIITNKRTIKVDQLNVTEKTATLKFNINDIISKDENIEAVVFKNNNTYKKLEVSNIRFYDEKSKSGIKFKNELTSPQDAVIEFDGIKIKRPTNTIDDAIKDITLNIFDKTDREENLKVDRNYEKIVGSITEMLKTFNELIEMINNETHSSADPEARGKFSGDYSIVSLGSKLRIIMMNPYSTSFGKELTMLAQIGISTDASGTFQMNKEKLKGILEIDENLFINMMEKYPAGIKELFGMDTNNDLVVDSGVAFELDKLIKGYALTGQGLFDSRTRTYDEQIANTSKDIKDYQAKLEKEEKDLKNKFYKMEKAMQDLEQNTKKIDNFNKQNSGR
ncbi:MAG: flagellar filament capping protein FliD [Spirochaetes bacterium]|nr:flagellar filament capping protein FliD [Spirochaetota bacterium]